jgi:hypothetical protein
MGAFAHAQAPDDIGAVFREILVEERNRFAEGLRCLCGVRLCYQVAMFGIGIPAGNSSNKSFLQSMFEGLRSEAALVR